MKVLRRVAEEILGLFVDDWAFALLLIAWIVVMDLLSPHLPHRTAGPLLFVGLAILTLAFVARQARAVGSRR